MNENNKGGNFKVRCVDPNGYNDLYTRGKIYEFVNGVMICDDGKKWSQKLYDNFEEFKNASDATWELIKEESVFDWYEFKLGEFSVHCDTEEKAVEFLKECDENGITWSTGNRAINQTHWNVYKENTCYYFYRNIGLSYNTVTLCDELIVKYRPRNTEEPIQKSKSLVDDLNTLSAIWNELSEDMQNLLSKCLSGVKSDLVSTIELIDSLK